MHPVGTTRFRTLVDFSYWVRRDRIGRRDTSIHVRCASDSDQIDASQPTVAKCLLYRSCVHQLPRSKREN